jgi:hypothetical protein
MNCGDTFARLLVRGDESNFDIRMKQQNTEQFRTAVT